MSSFNLYPFASIWRSELQELDAIIKSKIAPYISNTGKLVLESPFNTLLKKIDHLAAKCCILELHTAKPTLAGSSSEERFQSFIAKISSPQMREYLNLIINAIGRFYIHCYYRIFHLVRGKNQALI